MPYRYLLINTYLQQYGFGKLNLSQYITSLNVNQTMNIYILAHQIIKNVD